MYCINCGNQIPDGAKFCIHCGKQVTEAAPAATQPIYQQPTQQIYQEPVHAVRRAPASNQVYQQAYAAAYAAPANMKVTSKWPVSTGIMGILYFVFTLVSLVPYLLYYVEVIEYPLAFFNVYRIIHVLMVIAVPVLFFVHTKKVAFVTAIPMFIIFVMDLISYLGNLRVTSSGIALRELSMLASTFILVVLYVIQMFVRSRSVALPVIFLILAILYLIFSCIFRLMGIIDIAYDSYSYFGIGSLIAWFAEIFAFVAYIIAMFSSRKR